MRIKYMGNADVRRLEKGENFGGQLSKEASLDRDIEWNWENNHIIDTDDEAYANLSDDVISLLLDKSMDGEFKDVTDLKRVPTNAAQQMWRGMAKSEEQDPSVKESGTAETDETSQAGGGPSEADAGTTDAGGTAPAPATGAAKKASGTRSSAGT